MSIAERLQARANEYEQRAAHHEEVAELQGDNAVSAAVAADVFRGVAIALREIALVIATDDEDLAA